MNELASMERLLKKLFYLLVVLSILLGFFVKKEHSLFGWHEIPAVEAIFGGIGALLLLMAGKFLASFASKKEDFYD